MSNIIGSLKVVKLIKIIFICVAILSFLTLNAFSLAPQTTKGEVLNQRDDLIKLQDTVNEIREEVNRSLGVRVLTHSYLGGSPIIFEKEGFIPWERVNDFEVILVYDGEVENWLDDSDLMKKFGDKSRENSLPILDRYNNEMLRRLAKHPFFKGKNILLNAFSKDEDEVQDFLDVRLHDGIEYLKRHIIFMKGKWYLVQDETTTKLFILRYLEYLYLSRQRTRHFESLKEKFLKTNDKEGYEALRDFIDRSQPYQKLRRSRKNYKFLNPIRLMDQLRKSRGDKKEHQNVRGVKSSA